MKAEPQKFFIGLMDFFSILLPGALLTYLLKQDIGLIVPGDPLKSLEDVEDWALFLFISYVIGHFVFLLGSAFLDDWVYDPLRNANLPSQARKLATDNQIPPKEKLEPRLRRWLADKLFTNHYIESSLNQVLRIKQHHLDTSGASKTINVFQWSKVLLTIENPAALAVVERLEADSKFFRSLFVVLALLVVWFFVRGLFYVTDSDFRLIESLKDMERSQWVIAVLFPIFGFGAMWRYIKQRDKAVRQAYWFIITMEASRDNGYKQSASDINPVATHAGGIVYRKNHKSEKEYLLVRALGNPEEWVLPKGHVELGESLRETAVREVREESGVWAYIEKELSVSQFVHKGEEIRVQYFLMQALEEGKQVKGRKRIWFTQLEALEALKHPESKSALEQAEG